MNRGYELIKFIDKDLSLDVRVDGEKETIWLTQEQIAKLFGKARSTITEHINNIFNDKELSENTSVGISDRSFNHRPNKLYNLDVVLSVGYRVNSKRGIQFRRWSSKILKDYLILGYAANERRMNALNKTIEIQNRMLASTLNLDNQELVNVISAFTNAFEMLDNYDKHFLVKPFKPIKINQLEYKDCIRIINSMKFSNSSSLFGLEKEEGKFSGIIAIINQEVFDRKLYETIESKAAHLLYFIIKDHPFIDGCKRIAATLFLEFLNKNNALIRNGNYVISNDALVVITILTAESKPEEMEAIINIIVKMINIKNF